MSDQKQSARLLEFSPDCDMRLNTLHQKLFGECMSFILTERAAVASVLGVLRVVEHNLISEMIRQHESDDGDSA